MLFSNPPERWSPSGWECEWYSSMAWWSCGISRLTSATFSSAILSRLLALAQGLFLVGVGDRVASLLRKLAAVKIGPRLHQVFLTVS